MKRIIVMIACVVAVLSACCDKVFAEAHTHDGFFLRLAPGIGSTVSTENVIGDKLEVSGMSGLFNLAIGGTVAENLIVHVDLTGASVTDPKVKVNGMDQPAYDTTSSTSLLGVGLTYYFPSNFYITGSIGIAESVLKTNGIEYSTDKGFGTNIMIGKEWWVSDDWGLGVAGQFLYTKCPDKPIAGYTPDVETTSFGLLFSATYN